MSELVTFGIIVVLSVLTIAIVALIPAHDRLAGIEDAIAEIRQMIEDKKP